MRTSGPLAVRPSRSWSGGFLVAADREAAAAVRAELEAAREGRAEAEEKTQRLQQLAQASLPLPFTPELHPSYTRVRPDLHRF